MQYKIEIFDRSMTFKSFAPVQSPQIAYDYLTQENITISALGIQAEKGDFVNITNSNGRAVFQGVVADISFPENLASLQIAPLLSLFDDVMPVLTKSTVETLLRDMISAEYVGSSDTLQNLPLSLSVLSSTTNYFVFEEPFVNLHDLIVSAFRQYGVVCSVTANFGTKKLNCTIGRITSSSIMEIDERKCISRSLTLGDSYGALNKLTVINAANSTQKATYYLHTDGTITTVNSDRISPVVFSYSSVTVGEGETFSDVAYAEAYDKLKPAEYDQQIEVTYSINSSLINKDLPIGSVVTLIDGSATYTSILTGTVKTENLITFTFGYVRQELTKRLIIERSGQYDSRRHKTNHRR